MLPLLQDHVEAVQTVIGSHGVHSLQIRSVGSHNTSRRRKERKKERKKEILAKRNKCSF